MEIAFDTGCNNTGMRLDAADHEGDVHEIDPPVKVVGVGGTVECTQSVDHPHLGQGFFINPLSPGNIVGGAQLADRHWVYHDQENQRYLVIVDPKTVYVFDRRDNLYISPMWRFSSLESLKMKNLHPKYHIPYLQYTDQKRHSTHMLLNLSTGPWDDDYAYVALEPEVKELLAMTTLKIEEAYLRAPLPVRALTNDPESDEEDS
jgi:hypothetical protein